MGLTWGVIPGWAFGLCFPWWISGMPCYVATALLWLRGVRGPLLNSFLFSTMAAAACEALGEQRAPHTLLLFWILYPAMSWAKATPWKVAVAFYLVASLWSIST
jgi:hypothetical protein